MPSAPFVAAPHATCAPCPFLSGLGTIDLLLAELNSAETSLFDAVLDLRSLVAAGTDAAAFVEQLFRVRALLDGRHHLAFFRIRRWAQHGLQLEVRADRRGPWQRREFPLNCARLDELINGALASLELAPSTAPAAHVRFRFAPAAAPLA